MAFQVDVGLASERGPRERNEDCAAVARAAPHEAQRGLIAAVADGVSFGGGGAMAAQTTVRALMEDFFAAPDTWDTSVVLDRVIAAQNAWLAAANRRADSVAMTTLSALALQGHGWTMAHVGDTRAWLLRGDEFEQLSIDHGLDHPDLQGQLTRAIGLEDLVRIDYREGQLHAGDCFVLTSDGVHRVLAAAELVRRVREAPDAQAASEALVRTALAAGGGDNATALVIRVHGLDAERLDDALHRAKALPVPGELKVGDVLDGLLVTALVADNGVHRLLQAREVATQTLVAMKTLSLARAGDAEERAMLAHEAWLSSRVAAGGAPGFVPVREAREPTRFYTLYDWVPGRTLEQLLASRRPFGVGEVIDAALQLTRALGRLHRQGVIHRDIKPANLHRGDDGQWRIIDFGAALSGREPEAQRSLRAGTPSYINPEQWAEPPRPPDAGSDLYALGVTLYRWLGGGLPYGEIEPYQLQRYRRDPPALSRRRPDVPMWLDHVVRKAVARDAKQRFETAEELLLALERGASRPLPQPGATPLMSRDPAALWKMALLISLLLNVLLMIWLLWLPR